MVVAAPPAHPWTVPSSVTKMKSAARPDGRIKSVLLPLNITPVGEPGAGWLGAFGTVTMPLPLMGTIFAVTVPPATVMEYKVEVPPALLDTHHGVPAPPPTAGPETSPQAFCRFGSLVGAAPVLETILVWL